MPADPIVNHQSSIVNRPWPAIFAMAALLWALTARVLGPSDLWDQTQPKTVSYTTDIIVNGGSHWILPVECGELPATKPPLYNWLAAPFVKLLGFSSEIGHKFPSIIALSLCWLIVVRLGRRLDSGGDQSVGWLAGLIFVANASMFKLGYLARPDMLLTLWLLLAWVMGTAVLVAGTRHQASGTSAQCLMPSAQREITKSSTTWLVLGFWACIALAGLTKGPPAVVGVIYVAVAARVLTGSWRAVRVLRPMWGIAACLLVVGAWVYGVWRINPEHLRQELWFNEICGRFTGTGPKGSHEGLRGWLIGLSNQSLYFLERFAPWSVGAILAMIALWRERSQRRIATNESPSTELDNSSAWLKGAAIQVLVVVGLFTLSAGRRADYIPAAFAPGALLAAWWLLRMPPHLGLRFPWLGPAAAVISLAALTAVNQAEPAAPQRGAGAAISGFMTQAAVAIAQEPLPVVFCWTDNTHVQAMLGGAAKDGPDAVMDQFRRRQPFWVVAGRRPSPARDLADWLSAKTRMRLTIEPVVGSAKLPRMVHWPEQVTLYRVTPHAQPASRNGPPGSTPPLQ